MVWAVLEGMVYGRYLLLCSYLIGEKFEVAVRRNKREYTLTLCVCVCGVWVWVCARENSRAVTIYMTSNKFTQILDVLWVLKVP